MSFWIREFAMHADDPERLAVRPAHREYVARLFETGSIRMSGPLVGDEGAVMIYVAPSRDAVEELVAQDPYTLAGVVHDVSLREWTVVSGA